MICIICANGNDLPEGEACPSCGRVGPAIHDHGLRLRDPHDKDVKSAISRRPRTGAGRMSELVKRLREREKFAREETTATSLGDALHFEEAAARIEALEAALRVCVDTLQLVERPNSLDPQYGEEVRRLGDRIGYGAMMSSASASWRKKLAEDGYPVGTEFVAGPCHGSVLIALKKARAALAPE